MVVFKIGKVDYAKNIVAGSYDVNQIEKYIEWTDALMYTHRKVTATKVVGSVQMAFKTLEEYNSFLDNLQEAKGIDCFAKMTVSVNNGKRNNIVTSLFYVNFSTVRNIDYKWDDYMEPFTFEFEEA